MISTVLLHMHHKCLYILQIILYKISNTKFESNFYIIYWVNYRVLSYSVGNALLPWFIKFLIKIKKRHKIQFKRLGPVGLQEKNTNIQQVEVTEKIHVFMLLSNKGCSFKHSIHYNSYSIHNNSILIIGLIATEIHLWSNKCSPGDHSRLL